MRKSVALLAAIFSSLFFAEALLAAPLRITDSTGQDISPVWEPNGNRIVYMRSISPGGSGVPFDLYYSTADGSVKDAPFLTGLFQDFGIGNSPSWVGSTGQFLTEERINFHEYLFFNASQAPFSRTVQNGTDAACTPALSIDGGGGGGIIKVSRNGLKAVVRFSTSGGGGTVSIRTGDVSALNGTSASTFGTLIFSENTGADQKYLAGTGVAPDGSAFAQAQPIGSASTAHDIWQYPIGGGTGTNLTNTAAQGVFNIQPDYSPDGTKIAFARFSGVAGETYDLYMMNIDGSGLTQLTNTPAFAEVHPSWSPDGTKIAFTAAHLAGREDEEPALPAGESPNNNIYVMNLSDAPEREVNPGTTPNAPVVTVAGDDATITAEEFNKASFKKSGKAILRALTRRPAKGAKVSFKYEFTIKRTADENGAPVKKNSKSKLSKRNEYTFKNLPPGNYSASYRVELSQKKDGNVKVKRTKPSPASVFAIAPQ